jgi:hypothetical protein
VLDEIKAGGYGGDDGGELPPEGPWHDESR